MKSAKSKKQKKFSGTTILLNLILGANFASLLLLYVSGYNGLIYPGYYPLFTFISLAFPFFLIINLAFVFFWIVFHTSYIKYSVLGLLIAFYPIRTYIPFNFSSSRPEGCIKVVSYNCKSFAVPRSKDSVRFDNMLAYLSNLDADILCLQEGHYKTDNANGKAIEAALSSWQYIDTIHLEHLNGIVLCSKYPILEKKFIACPSPSHGARLYKLKLPSDTIYLVNCHFVSNSLTPQDKEVYSRIIHNSDSANMKDDTRYLANKVDSAGVKRAIQADTLYKYLKEIQDKPLIVCGDFNDSPLAYPHYKLVRLLNDAYTSSGNGPGLSYNESKMFFRIDNILCSKHWKSYNSKVDKSISSSDHYPIQTYLKLDDKYTP